MLADFVIVKKILRKVCTNAVNLQPVISQSSSARPKEFGKSAHLFTLSDRRTWLHPRIPIRPQPAGRILINKTSFLRTLSTYDQVTNASPPAGSSVSKRNQVGSDSHLGRISRYAPRHVRTSVHRIFALSVECITMSCVFLSFVVIVCCPKMLHASYFDVARVFILRLAACFEVELRYFLFRRRVLGDVGDLDLRGDKFNDCAWG